MPDFGDEMGEKLVRLMDSYLGQMARNAANEVFQIIHDHKAAKLAAAQEALGEGLIETTEEGFDSMSADGKVLHATYKVGTNNELDLPDETTPADAVDGFYEELKKNLSSRGCGALLQWSFDEDSNVLSYSVAREGKEDFKAALQQTSLHFADKKAMDEIHEQMAREIVQAGEVAEPEQLSFDIDLSKIAADPSLQNDICEAMRGAVAQTPLAGKVSIGSSGGVAHVAVLHEGPGDPGPTIRGAAWEIAKKASALARSSISEGPVSWATHAHDTALADGIVQLADGLAPKIERRVVCQFVNPEDGAAVAKEFTASIPFYRPVAFDSAVKDLDQLIVPEVKSLPDGSVFVTFDSPEAVEQSVRQLDWKLQEMAERRTFKAESVDGREARRFAQKSPYINQELLDRAKQASEDLISGRASTPPGYNPPIPKAPAPTVARN